MVEGVLNLFAIGNLADLSCTYRLLEITNLPDNDRVSAELNRLLGMFISDTHKPACIYKKDNKTYLATTADISNIKTEWRLVPHIVKLIPDDCEYQLNYNAIALEQIQIAIRILSYKIRRALNKNEELWNDKYGSFYFRQPKNINNSQINILNGFVYRLHYLQDGKIYLSLDSTVRYIDSKSLWEYLQEGAKFNSFRWQHFIYKFGYQWYRVQLFSQLHEHINKQIFYSEKDKQSYNIYDYTLNNCKKPLPDYISSLAPDSSAIIYRYPNKEDDKYGAAALCFKTYKTNDFAVKQFHRSSILRPNDRLTKSQSLINNYFQNINFSSVQQINITSELYKKEIKRFDIPDLLFGQDKVLRVKQGNLDDGIPLKNYPKKREYLLSDREAGILIKSGFKTQYIFVPKSLDRQIADKFKQDFVERMKNFTVPNYITKTILFDDRDTNNLHQQVKAIKKAVESNNIDSGYGLLMLPENAKQDLHNFIKKELYDVIQFQCIDVNELKKFFVKSNNSYNLKQDDKTIRGFSSYVKYTAFGMLQVNRKWLYALSSPLNHDVYIGIDVLNHMAGFTYVYNGGKDCYFRYYESKQAEKLSKKQVYKIIKEDLQRDISNLDIQPKSIIIHRDGRSFDTEKSGFRKAIKSLQEGGFLSADVLTGIVEIHKSSAFRMRLCEENNGMFVNPHIGDYFIFDSKQGIVCNTGYPFRISGTANPLFASIAEGYLNIEFVLEDIFCLSQLAYAAPSSASRNPSTISIGDFFLEAVASDSDREAALYSEDNEDDDDEDDE